MIIVSGSGLLTCNGPRMAFHDSGWVWWLHIASPWDESSSRCTVTNQSVFWLIYKLLRVYVVGRGMVTSRLAGER